MKNLVAVVGLSILSHTVSAQTAGRNSAVIEEILVTAQKRSQEIQSVGITMNAYNSGDIRNHSMNDLPELANLVSNTQLFEDYGNGFPTWVIRGVGLQDFNTNNTPTAAIYIDEIYQTSAVMGDVGLFDVERVEILKGPQGGLYGRNTSGGAVNLITKAPELGSDEGYISIGYASWQNLDLEAASDFALSENLAVRVAGRIQNSGDAWQTSLVDGSTRGEVDRKDLRTSFLYSPNSALDFRLKLYGGEDNSELALARSVGLYNASGGLCDAVLQGYRDQSSCLDWASLNRVSFGESAYDLTQQAGNGKTTLSDPINQHSNDFFGVRFEADLDFDSTRLTTISSFDRFDYGVTVDLDGSNGEYGHRISSSDIEVWSQEIRLASTTGDAFQWLVGISATNDFFVENKDFLLRDNLIVGLGRGTLDYNQLTQSRAIYAQFDYQLNESWAVSSDLRYTNESKKYRDGNFRAPFFPPPFDYFIRNQSSDYDLDNHFSGKIQLEWNLLENSMVYGSISRGFKAGGFFGGFPFTPEEVAPYREEHITAYEVGVKNLLLDGTLIFNLAAFYYDYRDVQGFITQTNPTTTTEIDKLDNQGDAEHKGIELELNWLLSPGLTITTGIGYLDAKIIESNAVTLNLEGESVSLIGKRAYAPNWNANVSLMYSRPMTSSLVFNSVIDYNYRSEFSGHLSSPADIALRKLPGYGLLNARIGVTNNDDTIALNVWIKNITDKVYRNRVRGDGLRSYGDIFGEPRSWGVSLEYSW